MDALRRGMEERDAEAQAALYADDAVLLRVNSRTTPSAPERFEGKAAIHAFLTDVAARDMTHR